MSESDPLKLIVGLGNPGPSYDQTRHNAGFWFVDELARHFQTTFRSERKYMGEICRIAPFELEVWLFKPLNFMNRSGQALVAIRSYLKIPTHQILVAHDEIDLPPGMAKLKRTGGHGGHNGLRDVISHLGRDFWRLRIGVGHPGHRDQVTDYVLSRPSRADAEFIHESIDKTTTLLPLLVSGEMEQAMHRLHSKPPKKETD